MKIIAYAYDSALHCPECAYNDAAVGLLKGVAPLSTWTDEHGLTDDLVDRESNPVHPVFSTDETEDYERCDDCGELLS